MEYLGHLLRDQDMNFLKVVKVYNKEKLKERDYQAGEEFTGLQILELGNE